LVRVNERKETHAASKLSVCLHPYHVSSLITHTFTWLVSFHLRGCHPDRVLLHPASACHTHRGLLARNFWPSRPTMEVRTRIAQLAASRHADGVDDVDPFVGNRFGSAGDACARQISERESEHSSFDRSAYLGRCTLASPVVPSLNDCQRLAWWVQTGTAPVNVPQRQGHVSHRQPCPGGPSGLARGSPSPVVSPPEVLRRAARGRRGHCS
jgi:hypothetical protein